ncbi:hypothetical protein AB0F24_38560 [Streptomyces platensis]|uniref:hypothetical protein n=1 Tax=Streptomyces platensis TaxID=58346 RepID=UPI0033CF41A1
MFGELPAVLPAYRTQQPMHISPHPPPQISPAEAVADPQQHLFQLACPHIRPHILLRDQYTSDHPSPVTNNRHMTGTSAEYTQKDAPG